MAGGSAPWRHTFALKADGMIDAAILVDSCALRCGSVQDGAML